MFPLVNNKNDKIGQRHIRNRHDNATPLSLRLKPLPLGDAYYDYNAVTETPTYDNESANTSTGVWNYMLGATLCLVFWVFGLMLPKGFRKQLCGANPRRYSRRRYDPMELGGDLSTNLSALDSVDESVLAEVERRRMGDISIQSSALPSTYTPLQPGLMSSPHKKQLSMSVASESDTGSLYLRPMTRKSRNAAARASPSLSGIRPSPSFGTAPPSPGHPAITRLPSAKILNETMQRLKSRGIRLVAHGVASDSKRVWIKFEEDTTSLSWQTEFARKVPNNAGEVSIVMMRGALHRIALPNILFVDVGKKTNALMKQENASVPDSACFSLLTQNGSLDLQANSRLERDALVSCFSMVLDEVHTQDWRSLYAESPETSAVQSSCTGSDLNQVEF